MPDSCAAGCERGTWACCCSAAAQSATVNALSVRTINPANQAPTAAVQADVTSGNAPLPVHRVDERLSTRAASEHLPKRRDDELRRSGRMDRGAPPSAREASGRRMQTGPEAGSDCARRRARG